MIDLHTHSNVSDGTDTPTVLLAKAKNAGLKVIALTDHDTDLGWQEAIANLPLNLELVLGCEFSALDSRGKSVHILGLLFDNQNQKIQENFLQVKESRIDRSKKILKLLNSGGFLVTEEELFSAVPTGATLGRPHIADLLVKKGYLKDRNEAFAKVLNDNSPFYVGHDAPTSANIIEMIKSAGGVSILAHPRSTWSDYEFFERELKSMVAAGLDGIEVNHRDHSLENRRELFECAAQYNLIPTGASDYHGNGKLNLLGENTTSEDSFERLKSKVVFGNIYQR